MRMISREGIKNGLDSLVFGWIRLTALVVLSTVLFMTQQGFASSEEDFNKAQSLFEQGEFKQSISNRISFTRDLMLFA